LKGAFGIVSGVTADRQPSALRGESGGEAPGRGRRGRAFPRLTKYDIREELGHGGMATVYRAHDSRLQRDVAVKVLHPHLRDSAEVAARFLVEARAVAKLRHRNILEVYDVAEEDEDERWLAVELVRGATLRTLLAEHGKMPAEVAGALAIEILCALEHAHEAGIVHRDVKPENVMVAAASALETGPVRTRPSSGPAPSTPSLDAGSDVGEAAAKRRASVKLMDFGIAKVQGAQGVTSTGQVLGSPAHMAPEQIEGGDVDERVDVFAVGVLLYEAMVGALPFAGANPAQVLRRVLEGEYVPAEHAEPTVGKRWSVLVDRALAHAKDDRFPAASAMKKALEEELARVGFADPRQLLASFLDAPEAFSEELRKSLVLKLTTLGAAAQKVEDALTAAQDYSRALALAPDDRKLLGMVTSLRKSADRRRLLRRVLPAAGALLLLAGGAYGGTRLLTRRPPPPRPVEEPVATVVASTAASVGRALVPLVSMATPISSSFRAPLSAASRPVREGKRSARLDRLEPPAGVLVAIDGQPPVAATQGGEFPIDSRAHDLRFSCVEELCEPQIVRIAEGDRAVPIAVKLAIRPATLLVEGDKMKAYGVEERPYLRLSAGLAVTVSLDRGTEHITVIVRETGQKRSVLLRAGKKATVDFGP
jgi:serine/threonine-protein kinase